MKIIKILVAITSEKLKNERKELGDFIRTLNDHYHDKAIYFHLDSLLDIETEKKDQELRDSDFFYIIFCDKADDSIVKKFDVALQHFKEKNSPRIYTYFQKLPDGSNTTESVKNFMERLDKEIGHYYSVFSHLDSIKLNMLLELTRTQVLSGKVVIKDGKALVDGKEMLSLENVPIFRNNEEFHKLIKERDELQKGMAELALKYAADPSDIEVSQQLSNNAVRRKEITEQLHQMEKNMLEICSAIAERNSSGKPITWREKEASRYLDEGNYESALAILRDTNRINDLEQARAVKKSGMEGIIGFINEDRLRIQALEAKGRNSNTLPEIYECYEEAIKVAEEEFVETDIIYEYAVFLYQQKKYKESFKKTEWLKGYYNLKNVSNNIADSKKADLFNLLGALLLIENRYEEAEKEYRKAIVIWEELARENPAAYERDLTRSYNALGDLFNAKHRYAEAEKTYEKAKTILERLAESNPVAYEDDFALSYVSLGGLFSNTNRYEKAEIAYDKAKKIWEKLSVENPAPYDSRLAIIYNNLGNLFMETSRYEGAELFHEKAKTIRERLAEANPSEYDEVLASSYNNLGIVFKATHRYAEAVTAYEKANMIWEKLYETNPAVYENRLGKIYGNLGNLYKEIHRYAEAEIAYKKAILFLEKLAKVSPEAYESDLAKIFRYLGDLYRENNRYPEAEDSYEKAKTIQVRLAEADPVAYEDNLASTYNSLGIIYKETNRYEEAEAAYVKAKTIWERLADSNLTDYEDNLATIHNNLGILFKKTRRYEEAEIVLKKAIVIWERLTRENPVKYESNLVSCYTIFGNLLDITGRKNEAQEFFMKVSKIKERQRITIS